MLLIPFEMPPGSKRGPIVLVVILEKENLDRMKQGDPFDARLHAFRSQIPVSRPISDFDLVIAYEEDIDALMNFQERQDLVGLLRWIERGRKIEPGDLHAPFPLRRT